MGKITYFIVKRVLLCLTVILVCLKFQYFIKTVQLLKKKFNKKYLLKKT